MSASFRNSAEVSPPHDTIFWRWRCQAGRGQEEVGGGEGAREEGLHGGCKRLQGAVSAHQSGLWLSGFLTGRQGPSTAPRAPCNTPLNTGGLLKL